MSLHCSKCKQWKDESEFGIRNDCKRGRKSECNSCVREWFDIRHAERNRLREQLKLNGCAICGYDKCIRALEFHHVIPEDKLFGLNQREFYTRNENSLLDEVQKCILLCANCHKEIT